MPYNAPTTYQEFVMKHVDGYAENFLGYMAGHMIVLFGTDYDFYPSGYDAGSPRDAENSDIVYIEAVDGCSVIAPATNRQIMINAGVTEFTYRIRSSNAMAWSTFNIACLATVAPNNINTTLIRNLIGAGNNQVAGLELSGLINQKSPLTETPHLYPGNLPSYIKGRPDGSIASMLGEWIGYCQSAQEGFKIAIPTTQNIPWGQSFNPLCGVFKRQIAKSGDLDYYLNHAKWNDVKLDYWSTLGGSAPEGINFNNINFHRYTGPSVNNTAWHSADEVVTFPVKAYYKVVGSYTDMILDESFSITKKGCPFSITLTPGKTETIGGYAHPLTDGTSWFDLYDVFYYDLVLNNLTNAELNFNTDYFIEVGMSSAYSILDGYTPRLHYMPASVSANGTYLFGGRANNVGYASPQKFNIDEVNGISSIHFIARYTDAYNSNVEVASANQNIF